ncbi:MAG TPA: cbb3-type cytochrome oxidase assembly protein CcoS [Holophagaceae bacterium]|nr:cbb3-type cytochrome oxidase assembly protein CcoS [Holophagaceae bacterium]
MSVVIILLPLALLLALGFVLGFIWSVKKDQYDEGDTPALRMLVDDSKPE